MKKIYRSINKAYGKPTDESLIVIDSNVGQNSIQQAKIFSENFPLTGIILTKLDGTAKGGVVVPIYHNFKIPIRFVCFGESVDHIMEFSIDSYLDSLLK